MFGMVKPDRWRDRFEDNQNRPEICAGVEEGETVA